MVRAAAVDWVGGVAEGEARVDAEAVAAGGRPAWVAVGPEAVWAAEVAFVETAAGAETVAGVAAVTAVTTAAVAQEVGKVVMEGVVARVVVDMAKAVVAEGRVVVVEEAWQCKAARQPCRRHNRHRRASSQCRTLRL